MKIRWIVPVTTKEFGAMTFERLSRAARADTELSMVYLDKGPASIESKYEEALAVPDILAKIVQAEKDGVQAVISGGGGDAGVAAARELVSIPVIGPGETSMHVAAMLGHRFSVVTVLDRLIPLFQHMAADAGLAMRLASVRSIGIPVLELRDNVRVLSALVDQSVRAVREDGAHVIIFGGTAAVGLARDVEDGLRKKAISDVPVVDPATLALKIAEALVDAGLCHSKRSYPIPPKKEIIGY